MYAIQNNIPTTPFYYYDITLLRETISQCLTASRRRGYHVHYAIKANFEPRVLSEISQAGMGADCVSGWEVKAAVESGFLCNKIVFAGVGKSDVEIEYALEKDIFAFNCESLEEMEVINSIALKLGRTAKVALRINPDIAPDTHRHINTGHGTSKFGIAYTEIDHALTKLSDLQNLKIVGLHFHIGSQILNYDSFVKLAQKAGEINDWFYGRGIRIEHLNMGGGLGVDYVNPEQNKIVDFEAYFNVFSENLKVRTEQTVHFELGRAIVAQCGELISKVLFTKTATDGANYAIIDAGMTELIRPALYDAEHQIANLTAVAEIRPTRKYYISGPICESSDTFAHNIDFPQTFRGDIISIRSVGAYGSSMSSNYNMRPKAASYFSE